jgi:hypothetical protein
MAFENKHVGEVDDLHLWWRRRRRRRLKKKTKKRVKHRSAEEKKKEKSETQADEVLYIDLLTRWHL